MSFEIDARQFYEFAEAMGAAPAKLDAAFRAAGEQAGQKGVQFARAHLAANGSIVTRKLYNSIQVLGVGQQGDVYTIRYGPSSQYPAEWVEGGRGPVHARAGGMLRFRIKNTGPYIFTKSVGPAAPRPFMQPSLRDVLPVATKLFGDAAMRVIGGML